MPPLVIAGLSPWLAHHKLFSRRLNTVLGLVFERVKSSIQSYSDQVLMCYFHPILHQSFIKAMGEAIRFHITNAAGYFVPKPAVMQIIGTSIEGQRMLPTPYLAKQSANQ